ncbi:hypothetical protein DBB36_03680 [Flavobacterium sp. WLB]|nr:hypothetical protein AKO67_10775 [Flavobacterium sp. VMW]OWU92193.1 hypothetical protein APR43_02865 [Flavobacterium sp. NLM]PUU71445.1 hypothetical protein DBB36_03680 [Flavobacterium sp. WLB]
MPPALAGGSKQKTEKALAKLTEVWLKPFLTLIYFFLQLKLEATNKKLCVSATLRDYFSKQTKNLVP